MAPIPPKFANSFSSDHGVCDVQSKYSGHLKSARDLISIGDQSVWKSGNTNIDAVFAEIKPGEIVEWGIPSGLNGRLIPLQFFKGDMPASVWIYHHDALAILASSWISHGVNMDRLFFIRSDHPVKQLRPLFLDDSFKRIVIDAPKKLSKGDLAFISRQARHYRQSIFLIRHFFISPRQGNPYASLRINCCQNRQGNFELTVLKGGDQFRTLIPQSDIVDHVQF